MFAGKGRPAPRMTLARASIFVAIAVLAQASPLRAMDRPALEKEVVALFEQTPAEHSVDSEALRELRGLQRARMVRVLSLTFDDFDPAADQVSASFTVQLELRECRDNGWSEIRLRHYRAVFSTGQPPVLRSLTFLEDALAGQIASAAPRERESLLSANEALVHGELARALVRSALTLINSTGSDAAPPLVTLAETIARQHGDRAAASLVASMQSILARKLGQLDLSRRHANDALVLARELGDPDVLARACLSVARAAAALENHAEAEHAALLEARMVAERAVDPVLRIRAIEGLVVRALDLEDHVTARRLCDDLLRLSGEAGDTSSEITATSNLGSIYFQQGDFDLAMYYAIRARDLAEASQSWFTDFAAVTVAELHLARGSIEHADRLLKTITESPLADTGDSKARRHAMEAFAEIAIERGRTDEAECLLRAAAELKPTTSPHTASLLAVARKVLEDGDPRRALALALEQAAGWSIYPRAMAAALDVAGRACVKLGMERDAHSCFLEAVEFHEEAVRNTTGTQFQKVTSADGASPSYRELAALLVRRGASWEAFEYSERGRARSQENVRGSHDAGLTPTERENERALTNRLEALNLAVANSSGHEQASLLAELDGARLDLAAFQEKISARNPTASSSRHVAMRTVVARLAPHALYCEYVVAGDEVILFVVEPAAANPLTTYRIDIGKVALRGRVEEFLKLVSTADLAFRQPARTLFDLLLGPIAGRISRHREIVIAPDGVLWKLPFAALIDRSGRYVVERSAISYTPSLRLLTRTPERSGSSARLLAIGNPTLEFQAASQITSVYRGVSLAPLPDAEDEVLGLRDIYGAGRSRVFIRDAATEAAVTKNWPDYGVIHFATHGVLDDRHPMYSRLILAKSPGPEDDGFLEAWEIANARLRADLVVLSACDTAMGRETNAEGLIGMTWAFLQAGAKSVVSTQWKVDSESAARLMLTFHDRLQSSPRAATGNALREAQLRLMRDRKLDHPYYWAAFLVVTTSVIDAARPAISRAF
jgi:CHAT domain-containing protein